MTWEELIKKVKDIPLIDIEYEAGDLIGLNDDIFFGVNGKIYDRELLLIAETRTPDQMYQIIKALTEKE